MDELTRRRFLLASGVTGAVGLAAGAVAGSGPGWTSMSALTRRAATDRLAAGTGVLVVVTLYGGNDGLNTVVPYADPAYHDARPGLAYSPDEVLHLDATLGLNPALKGLARQWQQRRLAIVRGVGYPRPDHSHFRSMDIWQTASPDEPLRTGWIGRWLDVTGDDPVRAVNVGAVLPPLAVGARSTAAALQVGGSALAAPLAATVPGLGRDERGDGSAAGEVCAAYRAERVVAATLGGQVHGPASTAGSGRGGTSLADQLAVVSRCVKAGVPTRVYAVSLGGFDTHADEKATQQALLGTLDTALSSFLDDMAADPHGKHVTLLVYSEFGRRVRANAGQGTDHGTAGPVLLAGVPVRGGFYGGEPSLTDLDDGDLKADVDFRAVYAELLAGVLGSDPAAVLGSDRPRLGFLA